MSKPIISNELDFFQSYIKKEIQLDLFNNAMVLLKKPYYSKNLQLLKDQLMRKLSNKKIKKIIFLSPKPKTKEPRARISLFQRKIIEFFDFHEDITYIQKLKDVLKHKKKSQNKVEL